jgi:hypothetical protein
MISKDELIQVLEEFLENLKNNKDEKNWMIKPFIYIGVLSLMKILNDKFDLGLDLSQ